MHSFIFNLLSLVKKALGRDFCKNFTRVRSQNYELKKRHVPASSWTPDVNKGTAVSTDRH